MELVQDRAPVAGECRGGRDVMSNGDFKEGGEEGNGQQ